MNPEVGARASDLRRTRVPFVHARVVRAERPTSAKPGDEAVVLPDGTIEGFVGGVCAEATVRAQSLSLLDSGETLLLRIFPEGADAPEAEPGALTVVNPCLSGGTLEIFLEPVVPAPSLAVVGESPIAAALAELAPRVGLAMVGGGDDPTAVVVASHGRGEEAALEDAVRAGVPYVGLVASPKRGTAVVAGLDLDDAERARIHTPAGFDIGARTPAEVALSILAEIVALRPRPTGRPLAAPAASPGTATDPVCGMEVVAGGTTLHLDHDGDRHWFCGSGCLRAFAADPAAYRRA
ncbi:MAG TPA: XdhC family protein [Acidimicrobiales bacterium]|nr:XdhC family protein [Acidimicrobiales bacterium]